MPVKELPRLRIYPISASSITQFLDCALCWYFRHCPDLPKRVDYARLCGIEVHRFIPLLYEKTKAKRPFYFASIETAISQWTYRWNKAVEKAMADGSLVKPDKDLDKIRNAYCQIGIKCITNYWLANAKLARPIEIEQRYSGKLDGIPLVGIIDQLREVSIDWIIKHRPDIVVDGQLKPNFDSVIIVDLKTGFNNYDAEKFNDNPTQEEWARTQYGLHKDVQATLYTYLYHQKTGKMPVGFWWYHLRSGNAFFSYREERSFVTLADQVHYLVDNATHNSFPERPDDRCKRCDYLVPCNDLEPFLVYKPEGLETMPERESVDTTAETDKVQQPRLALGETRNRRNRQP